MSSSPDSTLAPSKTRCVFLIDGFNLYHSLRDNPIFCDYRWLDVKALARAYIAPSKEVITAVFYFTALPTWDDQKRARHQKLIDVYEDLGVIVKRGVFLPAKRHCKKCGELYPTHEEKNTDINICLELLRMGQDDIADRVFLVTADSDQTAAIERFKTLYPGKEIFVIFPPGRHSTELQQVCHADRKITFTQLKASKLSDPYQCRDGRLIVKPQRWSEKPTKFPPRPDYR